LVKLILYVKLRFKNAIANVVKLALTGPIIEFIVDVPDSIYPVPYVLELLNEIVNPGKVSLVLE